MLLTYYTWISRKPLMLFHIKAKGQASRLFIGVGTGDRGGFIPPPISKLGTGVCFSTTPNDICVIVQNRPRHRCNVPIKNLLHTILAFY